MKFGPVPLAEAEGKILGHNVVGADGRRRLRKGRALTRDHLEILAKLGRTRVYVAELEGGDVEENEAAARVAGAAAGTGIRLTRASTGRVNLIATALGVLRVDRDRLRRLNETEGITVASVDPHAVVRAGQAVGTVKVIPYAVPEREVAAAEAVAREASPLLRVESVPRRAVALVLTGSAPSRERVRESFAPLTERVLALGSEISGDRFVDLDRDDGEAALADAVLDLKRGGAELILLAGETAVMDRHDITPRAVERAGGRVETVGAPVDPGNLLMLAYLDGVPILGAPGCARSRKTNVVDWVLPRLLAGDRLTRGDILDLGAGGLLEDVPERPLPRSRIEEER